MKAARFCGVAAALLLLSGCSSNGAWGQYARLVRNTVRNGMGIQTITREQAAAIAYASLGYRIDGGNQAMLVLATDAGGDLTWTASSHVVLMTRDGRILRSVGLPHDRGTTTAQGGQPLAPPAAALQAGYRSVRIVDFPDMGLYGVILNCTAGAGSAQTITILGRAISTRRVDEHCESRNPRWSFTDSYWIDPANGLVWRSSQHISPAGTVVQVDILRPPG